MNRTRPSRRRWNKLEVSTFPSLKRRGGCGINKILRSYRSAADGREARARQREALIVVSSAKPSGLNNFAELTTPAALFRNGSIFLIARPPLLFKGINILDASCGRANSLLS